MIIHLYALNYNELNLLPFFFEHYDSFVDRYFIFDDESSDGSIEYLQSQEKVELGVFERGPDSYVKPATDFYRNAWKASRGKADWVIIVNIDELIYHENIVEALAKLKNEKFSAVQCIGWEMVSQRFPTTGPLANTVTDGVRSGGFDKLAIFNPNLIQKINYGSGRHTAVLEGYVNISREHGFKLLHFKFLGSDYITTRYLELNQRRGKIDIDRKWGYQYALPKGEIIERQQRLETAARPVTLTSVAKGEQGEILRTGGLLIKNRAVKNARGGLREIWTQGDVACQDVRHLYMTTTLPGVVKAWYRHRAQTDNITVVSGVARFVLYKDVAADPPALDVFEITAQDCQVLTIPKEVWHGFQCVSPEPLIMLHLNSHIYNWIKTDEEKADCNSDLIPYRWEGASA